MIPGRRNHRRVVVILLFVLVLAVTAFQVFRMPFARLFGDFVSPYLRVPAGAESLIVSAADKLKSKDDLLAEVTMLRREMESLRMANSELASIRKSYNELRRVVSLQPIYGYKYVRAQVTLRDPAGWDTTLTIGAGERDKIQPGYPVLAPARQKGQPGAPETLAVVGRVVSVTAHTAVVHTLVHPESNLSVFLPKASSAAMLRGGRMRDKEAVLDALYIPKTRTITESEEVVTSGLSPMTPEGLPVGYIVRGDDGALITSENQLDCSAQVQMSADVSYLHFVVIPIPSEPVAASAAEGALR